MEAWIPVVLSVIGSGGILMFVLNGIGKWVARRQEERAAEKLGFLTKIDTLQKQIFDMQQERIADEIKRRQETDNSTKVLAEMTVLLKNALPVKGPTP